MEILYPALFGRQVLFVNIQYDAPYLIAIKAYNN